jgi:phosphoglycerate kinase
LSVGVFDFDLFGAGTEKIARAIAETSSFTLAAGNVTTVKLEWAP